MEKYKLPERYSEKEQAEFDSLSHELQEVFKRQLLGAFTPIVEDAWKYKNMEDSMKAEKRRNQK